MEVFISEFYAISGYQWMATLFSLIYIFLAVRNQSICFVFGLLGAVFWGYESYFLLNLKFDAFLQMFYAFISIYGLYVWMKGSDNREERKISFFGFKPNVFLVLSGLIGSYLLFNLTQGLFDTEKAFIDLITTVFSIIATVLLVYRYCDNWIYWIFIDVIYMFLYWSQGGYLFALIMLVYTIMAVIGYSRWKALYLDIV